ncbi:MAG: hypothetical protein OXC25_03070 [Thiotrichales bacterium]|nr:hypothetical protein [Thiotrichales bacterium]
MHRSPALRPDPGDAAQQRAIADAVRTEIHWRFPRDRRVTVTVDGDAIAVAFESPRPAARREEVTR